jgi:hypothetical protein
MEYATHYNPHPYGLLSEDHPLNKPLHIPLGNYGVYWLNGDDEASQLAYAGVEDEKAMGISFPPDRLPEVGSVIYGATFVVYLIDHLSKKVVVSPA